MFEGTCKVGERMLVTLASDELVITNVHALGAGRAQYNDTRSFFAFAVIPGTFDYVVAAAPLAELEVDAPPTLSMEIFRLTVESPGPTMRLLVGEPEPVPASAPVLKDDPAMHPTPIGRPIPADELDAPPAAPATVDLDAPPVGEGI